MINRTKILHIIDDEKFVPYCQATFNLKELKNSYITSKELADYHHNLILFDLVIIHYLEYQTSKFLNDSSLSIPVIWFCWGGDVFDLGIFFNKFVLNRTKALRVKLAFRSNFRLGLITLAKTLSPKIFNMNSASLEIIQSIDQVDVVVPVVPGDYWILKNSFDIKPPLFHLNYVNPIFEQENYTELISNNILLGNSANFTSNHVEAINSLSKLHLGNRKVIIPLNYGDTFSKEYVFNYANKMLPNHTECITDFLPFEDYQQILASCSILVMNHLRQQAIGNLVQGIMNGANIYLNNTSTVYKFLKSKDLIVSEMDDLKNLRDLNEEEKEFNRMRCIEIFGQEQQHEKVKELITFALQKKLVKSPEVQESF